MLNAKGFVRFGVKSSRDVYAWLVEECHRRSEKLGRPVYYGEVLGEALTLLRERLDWQRGEAERVARKRKQLAERTASAEEARYPCEGCRVNPGADFVDGRWLCGDCKQQSAPPNADEATI